MKGTELAACPKVQLNLGSEAGENMGEVLCGLASIMLRPSRPLVSVLHLPLPCPNMFSFRQDITIENT